MTFEEYNIFVEKVGAVHHQAMVKKGFWEKPDLIDKEILIISELIEAVEALRAVPKKFPAISTFEERLYALNSSINIDYVPTEEQAKLAEKHFMHCYEKYIKDTFHDELAGTFLRLVDTLEGYKNIISPSPLYECSAPEKFSFFCKRMCLFVLDQNLTAALSLLYAYCQENSVDLERYVQLAMLYNSFRPYKHGKNF